MAETLIYKDSTGAYITITDFDVEAQTASKVTTTYNDVTKVVSATLSDITETTFICCGITFTIENTTEYEETTTIYDAFGHSIADILSVAEFQAARPSMSSFSEDEILECINTSSAMLDALCNGLISKVAEWNYNSGYKTQTDSIYIRTSYELKQLQTAFILQTQYTLNLANDFTQGSGSFSSGGLNMSFQRPEHRDIYAPGVKELLKAARVYEFQSFNAFAKDKIHPSYNSLVDYTNYIQELFDKRYVMQYQEGVSDGYVALVRSQLVKFEETSVLLEGLEETLNTYFETKTNEYSVTLNQILQNIVNEANSDVNANKAELEQIIADFKTYVETTKEEYALKTDLEAISATVEGINDSYVGLTNNQTITGFKTIQALTTANTGGVLRFEPSTKTAAFISGYENGGSTRKGYVGQGSYNNGDTFNFGGIGYLYAPDLQTPTDGMHLVNKNYVDTQIAANQAVDEDQTEAINQINVSLNSLSSSVNTNANDIITINSDLSEIQAKIDAIEVPSYSTTSVLKSASLSTSSTTTVRVLYESVALTSSNLVYNTSFQPGSSFYVRLVRYNVSTTVSIGRIIGCHVSTGYSSNSIIMLVSASYNGSDYYTLSINIAVLGGATDGDASTAKTAHIYYTPSTSTVSPITSASLSTSTTTVLTK